MRVIDGEVKVTTCCCALAAATPRECADAYSPAHKTPCRCFCHSRLHYPETYKRHTSDYLWDKIAGAVGGGA